MISTADWLTVAGLILDIAGVALLFRFAPETGSERRPAGDGGNDGPAAGAPLRIWVWSDLHLQHTNIIQHCNRPFDNVDEMDRRLLDAWRARVGTNDLVVNGGDVGLAGRVTGSILHAVERAPGRKLLVAGNHEIDRETGRVHRHGHDEVDPMAVLRTDPPLVLTHVPLHAVPDGWVNLHGHVHNNEPPRTPRHLNVCVEHTGYEPVALNDLVELAKKAVADVD